MAEYVLPVTTESAKIEFDALDLFTQSYLEALCWLECSADSQEGLDGLGFAEMTVATVAAAKSDCAKFQADNAALLSRAYDAHWQTAAIAEGWSRVAHSGIFNAPIDHDLRLVDFESWQELCECEGITPGAEYGDAGQAGHDFWLTRNRHGVGFWDRNLPDDIANPLTTAAQGFGEIDVFRECFIPAEQIAMNPADAWGYAATWGSAMTGGDPGACMYGFDERCLPQSEQHRADVLAWIAGCRDSVTTAPGDFDANELENMDSFVRYITQAALDIAH